MISIYLQTKVITYSVKKIDGEPTAAGRITLSDDAIVQGKIKSKEEVKEAIQKIFRIIGNHNDTLTVVLPAIGCSIKQSELPENLSAAEAKVYANEHAFDQMSGDYEYDHFVSGNKITYLYYNREQLELIVKIFKEIGKRIDYFDIPNIGVVREQYYISNNKAKFETTAACYVFYTEELVLLQINDGLYPITTYLANLKSYNNITDLINDETYRLCNFYRWNLSKGKNQVENLYIYPLNTTIEHPENITSQLTGVKNIYICNGKNNAYNTDADINVSLSKALFDPLLAHKIFDLRFTHPFKDTKHYLTAIIAAVCLTLLFASAFILGTGIYRNIQNQHVIEENLNMVKEKYNLAIADKNKMQDVNKKQYYSEYFESFEYVKENYNQNLTPYMDSLLKVLKENPDIELVNVDINRYGLNIVFSCDTNRQYLRFKDHLYEEFNPVMIVENGFSDGKAQTLSVVMEEKVNEEN